MAYLLDDASLQAFAKATYLGAETISIWFYPDDSANDGTLYAEHNGAATIYRQLRFAGGAAGDAVQIVTKAVAGVATVNVTSSGTANLNAWNHVLACWDSSSGPAISLNGATIDYGTLSDPGTGFTGMSLGRTGSLGGSIIQWFSGGLAECATWGDVLIDIDSEYEKLYTIRARADMIGATFVQSYARLTGNSVDWCRPNIWSPINAPTANASIGHPLIMEPIEE